MTLESVPVNGSGMSLVYYRNESNVLQEFLYIYPGKNGKLKEFPAGRRNLHPTLKAALMQVSVFSALREKPGLCLEF